MTRKLAIKFRDSEELNFYDILSLEDMQMRELVEIASQYTKKELREHESKGFDISYLTVSQKRRVIVTKNRIVSGRSPDELKKDKKVVFTLHSQERILERIGNNQVNAILAMIQKIIDADKVLKAQFKGYRSLTYTLTRSRNPTFKIPIRFRWVRGRRQILSVTVIKRGALPAKMTTKIAQYDKQAVRLEEFRRKLIQQSQKNKGHK